MKHNSLNLALPFGLIALALGLIYAIVQCQYSESDLKGTVVEKRHLYGYWSVEVEFRPIGRCVQKFTVQRYHQERYVVLVATELDTLELDVDETVWRRQIEGKTYNPKTK